MCRWSAQGDLYRRVRPRPQSEEAIEADQQDEADLGARIKLKRRRKNDRDQSKQLGQHAVELSPTNCVGRWTRTISATTCCPFLFLRYLSDNYETAAKKELGRDYPDVNGDARKVPLALWYANNVDDIPAFEKQMRRKVHYVISRSTCGTASPTWRTQNVALLNTLGWL